MKKQIGDYRYLAGSRRARGTLWEGPDHLLYIEWTGFLAAFTESYKRLDYSKIQSIAYGRTQTWWWVIGWLCLLAAGFAWGSYEMDELPGRIILGSIAGLLGIGLVIHLAKGPTCVCKVRTAVQVLKLKPLRRVRQAKRFADRLTELCLQHQGSALVDVARLAVTPELKAAVKEAMAGLKPPFTGSRFISWGLGALLVSGILITAEPYVDSLPFFVLDAVMAITACALVIIGLARNVRFRLPGALKGALWGAVANMIVGMITVYGILILASMQTTRDRIVNGKGFAISNETDLSLWLSHASFKELDWATWVVIGIGGLNIILALLGLPSALRPGARAEAAEAPPPMPITLPAGNEEPPAP